MAPALDVNCLPHARVCPRAPSPLSTYTRGEREREREREKYGERRSKSIYNAHAEKAAAAAAATEARDEGKKDKGRGKVQRRARESERRRGCLRDQWGRSLGSLSRSLLPRMTNNKHRRARLPLSFSNGVFTDKKFTPFLRCLTLAPFCSGGSLALPVALSPPELLLLLLRDFLYTPSLSAAGRAMCTHEDERTDGRTVGRTLGAQMRARERKTLPRI